MIRCYQSTRLQIKGEGSKEPSSASVAAAGAKKVIYGNVLPFLLEWKCFHSCCIIIYGIYIWERASIPVVSLNQMNAMILSHNCKYKNVMKPAKSRNTPFLQSKLDKFKSDAANLFDICACKCQDLYSCNDKKRSKVLERKTIFNWPKDIKKNGYRKCG